MKKIFTLVLLSVALVSETYSQDTIKTIFGNNDKKHTLSIFLGPEFKYSRVISVDAIYGGVKGALLFDRKYAFGLAAGSFLTETAFEGIGSNSLSAGLNSVMAYGGFYFDYIKSFNSPLQISFPTIIGGGGFLLLEKLETNPNTGIDDEKFVEGGVYFLLEPSINVEINIIRFLRIGLGGGYRFVINSDLERYSDSDLSAYVINFNIKIGLF